MARKMTLSMLVLIMLASMLTGCEKKSMVTGEPDIAGAYSEMKDPAFWIGLQKAPDELLMTSAEIAEFTEGIAVTEGTGCADLAAFPDTLSRSELLEKIRRYERPEEPRYQGDKLVTDAQYEQYYANRNEQAVQEQNPVLWGVVVENCEVRTFPTRDVSYNEVNDFNFDFWCESVIKTGECVAVLAASADQNWFLVQAYNYMGWAQQSSIAVTERDTWLELLQPPEVLVITGNRVALDGNGITPAASHKEFTMGTCLPLVADKPAFVDGISTVGSYVAQIPLRTAAGKLAMTEARFPMNLDVSVGYLAYTTRNITQQAFKLLGERYGWGGMWGARDCASTTADIYRCFGIDLPRNSSRQKLVAGIKTDLSQLTAEQRREALLKAPPGTLIYMPGHILLYLGDYQGEPYVFHQVYSFVPEKGEKPVKVATALVSSLSIKRANGQQFAEAITDLIVLQNH